MKYTLPIILLVLSIMGCINQNDQTNNSEKLQTEKQKFVWDFNSENIYVYSFEQIMNSVNNWGGVSENIDTSKIIGKGDLKIKSKGNNKADFVLILAIENDAFQTFKDEILPQTMVIPDMDANGQFESKRKNSDVMFDLIFPLPSKDLEIGESEKLELEVPFNLNGSPLYVKGYNKLKYLKDTDSNTALIKSEFKIDQLNVPKEIKGEFICSIAGEAEFEFNYKTKHFKSSKIELEMKMKSKFDSGENVMGNMEMESTSKYDIKFIEIEK